MSKIYSMMKSAIKILVILAAVSVVVISCETEPVSFDEGLLIGKWVDGTLYYKYFSDGTGGTWDTADDVKEEEAQDFEWTLVNAELTHIHILEIGGQVPKIYTVTELTDSTLIYHDDFGVIWSFEKVPQ